MTRHDLPRTSFRSELPSIAARNPRWPAGRRSACLRRPGRARRPRPSRRPRAVPRAPASVASARIGVAATPPSPMRALVTVPSAMSSANATATLLMSSNGRLAILWNAVVVAAGRGTTTSVISSPGARTDSRYPVKYSLNGTVRVPSAEARTTLASRASSTGGASPIGEPVPRLPPRVAPLRISREANCGNSAASSGSRPVEPALDLAEREGRADPDLVADPRTSRAARRAGRRRRRGRPGRP